MKPSRSRSKQKNPMLPAKQRTGLVVHQAEQQQKPVADVWPIYRTLADRRAIICTTEISEALAAMERAPRGTRHVVCEVQKERQGEWWRVAALER
jgi:hypothetical protein